MMQTNNNAKKGRDGEQSGEIGAAAHQFDALQKKRIRICEKCALMACIALQARQAGRGSLKPCSAAHSPWKLYFQALAATDTLL